MLNCLDERNLPLAAVTSYSTDNAAVNYGKNKSVYQKLSDKNLGLLKANYCFCHVLHNAGKYAVKLIKSRLDIETLANKIYAQFFSSTDKNGDLKICFDFFNMEYVTIFNI